MKERGMIFNAEMVRAILDGRKTQTRRIVKSDCMDIGEKDDGTLWPWREHDNGGDYWYPCPFGEVGDRIWVRETFAAFDADWKFPGRPHDLKDGPWPNVIYPASGSEVPPGTLRPSIHMPRWASRITLEITGVGVQRLQSISPNDASREGLIKLPATGRYCLNQGDQYFGGASHDAREVFSWLWESIYGAESWQSNPWVWAIEFKRIEGGA